MTRETFVSTFEDIYEHSRWVAETAWSRGVDATADAAAGLAACFRDIVNAAPHADLLALLRAHPDLAGRLAQAGALTAASTREQSAAGLDQCTPEELGRFQTLNEAYVEKFGFPFIVAVGGLDRQQILARFEARLGNSAEAEFDEALEQVHRIARLRLDKLLPESAS